jgi:hypothetical protein
MFFVGATATIVFAGVALGAGNQQLQRGAPGLVMALQCASGFNKGGGTDTYDCSTPVIRCPERQGMISGTSALPVVNSPAGIQFKYCCSYQKTPS